MLKPLLFFCLFCLINLTSCTTQTNPEAASLNTKLGIAYLKADQFSKAKEKLLLAEQEDPHSPEALGSLAYFYEITHHIKTANSYYYQSIKHGSQSASLINNYAVFLCKQKQYALAISYFLKAANLTSNLNPAETYENAGLCALKIPDKIQANSFFRLAAQNAPQHLEIKSDFNEKP